MTRSLDKDWLATFHRHGLLEIQADDGGDMEQEPNNPAEPDRPDTPTLTEIRSWPATVSVRMAAAAFGISTSHAYELIARGEFPAKVIRLGTRRRVVVTESIVHALSRGDDERKGTSTYMPRHGH
jgi:predicted DNA-binding transcriptional regulator AlpA